MRVQLRNARIASGKTQKEIAALCGISEVHYRKIEAGDREGKARIWDQLQELFGIEQRQLRECQNQNQLTEL